MSSRPPQSPDAPRAYGLGEAMELTHVGTTELARWLNSGVLQAGLGGAGAKGVHRRFSFFNVVEIAIAGALHEANISGRGIAGAINSFRWLDQLSSGVGRSEEDIARRRIIAPESAREWMIEAGRRDDVEAKRWAAFKRRTSKDADIGLLAIGAPGRDRHVELPRHLVFEPSLFFHFVDAFEQFNDFIAHDEPGIVGRPKVYVLVDVARIVADLEEATSDRL
jgi:hypothetical protein